MTTDLVTPIIRDIRLLTARAGFLAGYRSTSRTSYAIGLEQWFIYCEKIHIHPLDDAQRAHVDLFARWLEEERHLQISTVSHRLSILRGFYKYCEEEHIIDRSPAARIRMPKVSADSTTSAMTRAEISQLISISSRNSTYHALVCLLVLNGLRVSEACAIDIDHLGVERGHRTITVTRKGGRKQVIPMSAKTARSLDAAIGNRVEGPVLVTQYQTRMTRHNAAKIIGRLGRQAGINNHVHCHMLRHGFITVALDAGVPLHDVQDSAGHADPRTTMRYNRNRFSLDRNATHIVSAFVAGG